MCRILLEVPLALCIHKHELVLCAASSLPLVSSFSLEDLTRPSGRGLHSLAPSGFFWGLPVWGEGRLGFSASWEGSVLVGEVGKEAQGCQWCVWCLIQGLTASSSGFRSEDTCFSGLVSHEADTLSPSDASSRLIPKWNREEVIIAGWTALSLAIVTICVSTLNLTLVVAFRKKVSIM